MYSIDLLVQEHELILRAAKVMRQAALEIMQGKEVRVDDFRQMIDFVRRYADEHHHQKEEKVLFLEMSQKLGPAAEKLIRHGMLVEHDLGRFYMMALEQDLNSYEHSPNDETKLDIIANTIAYTQLIKRHIDKENQVVYTFGEKNLDTESKIFIDQETKNLEEKATEKAIQAQYQDLVTRLENKYKN